jgi:putative component of membrane protein insertase Oxa1/YidC/SpoIIIJ protein YidD
VHASAVDFVETARDTLGMSSPGRALGLAAIGFYKRNFSGGARRCMYPESCSDFAARRIRERGLVLGGAEAWRRYRGCAVSR